jgi:hypothetical protein
MRCPRCLRELADVSQRCDCGSVALTAPATGSALVRTNESVALVEVVPTTSEARLAQYVGQSFRRIVDSPQLARPLRLTKTYWPVAVVPTTVAVVAAVGFKTSLAFVGSALMWGMSIAIQLLGNM